MAKGFPAKDNAPTSVFEITGNLTEISNQFNKERASVSPFLKAGIAIDRRVSTSNVEPDSRSRGVALKDILVDEINVPEEFFISQKDIPKWEYLKGSKNEKRSGKNGFTFTYTEGPMIFPDSLDKPSRTIITAEGGTTPSRFKHVIKTRSGKLRRLMPIELERLCMFPDNHTVGQSDTRRAFFMGNALVVGVVERLGRTLLAFHLNT